VRHPAARAAALAIPLAYVIFDLAENAVVLALLDSFPARREVLAALLPWLTIVKRAASVLALLVPIAGTAISWRRERGPLTAGERGALIKPDPS
jgi:hypothetical protein